MGACQVRPDRPRPQRRRQVVAPARHRRPARAGLRVDPLGRQGHDEDDALPQGQGGLRLRAAGARDLPAAHGAREPDDRLRHEAARRAEDRRRDFRALPRAQRNAGAARRRPLGRPAAATRHRPRARDEAEASRPRRADRRHPAVDHQGHRPRPRASPPQGRDGHPRRRAIFRMGPRHLRRLRGAGPWRRGARRHARANGRERGARADDGAK
jgi:hypothetical protein